MSDLMFYGVLRMPYEMAMSCELSRRQFWSRVQEAADRVEAAEAELARRAAQSADVGAGELPPIEFDRSMERMYIPLPGGWEIQTKGNGSTFRIAHVPSRQRWQVLDDELHEPLEGLAREMRNHYADLRAQLASAQQAKEYEQRHEAESEKALAQVHAQLVRQSQGNRLLPREVFASDDAYAAYLQEWAAPPLSSEQQDPPINQCDGCRQGAPMTSLGNHIDSNGKPFMYCQKQRYESVGERQAEKEEGA